MRFVSMSVCAFVLTTMSSGMATPFTEDGLTLQKSLSNAVPCPVITTSSRFFTQGIMLNATPNATALLNGVTYEILARLDNAPFPAGEGAVYIVSNFSNAMGFCRYAYRVTKEALTTPEAKASIDTLHTKRTVSRDSFGFEQKEETGADKDSWTGVFVLRPLASSQK